MTSTAFHPKDLSMHTKLHVSARPDTVIKALLQYRVLPDSSYTVLAVYPVARVPAAYCLRRDWQPGDSTSTVKAHQQ